MRLNSYRELALIYIGADVKFSTMDDPTPSSFNGIKVGRIGGVKTMDWPGR